MGGEQPRNFFPRRISLHRREKACRIRLASRLFYAHLGFCKEAATNFLNFFKAKLGIHGISGRCQSAKWLLHGIWAHCQHAKWLLHEISGHCQNAKWLLHRILAHCRSAKAVHMEFQRIVGVQKGFYTEFRGIVNVQKCFHMEFRRIVGVQRPSTRNLGSLSGCKSRFSRKMRLALGFTNKTRRCI